MTLSMQQHPVSPYCIMVETMGGVPQFLATRNVVVGGGLVTEYYLTDLAFDAGIIIERNAEDLPKYFIHACKFNPFAISIQPF